MTCVCPPDIIPQTECNCTDGPQAACNIEEIEHSPIFGLYLCLLSLLTWNVDSTLTAFFIASVAEDLTDAPAPELRRANSILYHRKTHNELT